MTRNYNITEGMGDLSTDFIAPFHWNHHERIQTTPGGPNITRSSKNIYKEYKIGEHASESRIVSVLHRAANHMRQLVSCTGCRIYMVKAESRMLDCVSPTDETLRTWPMYESESEYGTFALYVAQTHQPLLVNENVYSDERFAEHTGWPDDRQLTACICMPVYTMENECMAVCEFTHSGHAVTFSENDMKVMTAVCGWLSTSLQQNQLNVAAVELEAACCRVVHVMSECIAGARTFASAINEVLYSLKKAVLADDLTMYHLVDHTFPKTADNLMSIVYEEARFEEPHQFVAKIEEYELCGILLDVYQHEQPMTCLAKPLGEERRPKARLQSTLVYPIRRHAFVDTQPRRASTAHMEGNVVALLLATSREIREGGVPVFTGKNLALVASEFEQAIANLCEYQRQHSVTEKTIAYNYMLDEFLHRRTRKLLRYVARPMPLPEKPIDLSNIPGISSFAWCPENLSQLGMVKLAFAMIMEQCGDAPIKPANLLLHIITVRKLHRQHPLHNFHHSFLCLHCVYCILTRYGDHFPSVERLAMMLGAISRNVEHMGWSNEILRIEKHPLSVLFKSGCMQQMQAYVVRNMTTNTNVLDGLNAKQKVVCHSCMEMFMVNPALQAYLRISRNFPGGSAWVGFEWAQVGHRKLVSTMISMVSTMSVMIKPFKENQHLAELWQQEIFDEGDAIKRSGLRPCPYYDRQIGWHLAEWFVATVEFVKPCFAILLGVMPDTRDMYEAAKLLEHSYKNIIDTRDQRVWFPQESYILK